MRYYICGVSFESAEPLPELAPSRSFTLKPSLWLRRTRRIANSAAIRPAIQWTLPDGNPFFTATKTEDGYLLHFDKLADYFIDNAGSEIRYSPEPNIPEHSVRHVLLDTVFPLALSLRGLPVFHASAIVTRFGACAFAASTGTGKSTLAASFQHEGYLALTDDCLLLEPEGTCVYGVPSYPSVRLREDSLSLMGRQNCPTLPVAHFNSKRRFGGGRFATGRQPMAAFYCLEREVDRSHAKAPKIEAISGADSLLLVLRFMFCLDPNDPDMLIRQFKLVEQLLASVPVLRLTIPDDLSALPRVHEAILSDLQGRGELTAPAPA